MARFASFRDELVKGDFRVVDRGEGCCLYGLDGLRGHGISWRCSLAFPTSGDGLGASSGLFAAERGIDRLGGFLFFSVWGSWFGDRVFDNLVLRKEKRGRRGFRRAL